MRATLPLTLGLALAGCSGTAPRLNGLPEQGMSAVIIGGRFILPTGETKNGRIYINIEGEGGRQAEVYRLKVLPKESLLYQIEPGLYRVSPTRGFFGGHQAMLTVKLEGSTYKVPFPRDILRKPAFDLKPKKIIAIGIVEAKLSTALPGQKAALRVRIDDSIDARRSLVQDLIHEMMDPSASLEVREGAISWSRALESSLMDLLSESQRSPLYKSAP